MRVDRDRATGLLLEGRSGNFSGTRTGGQSRRTERHLGPWRSACGGPGDGSGLCAGPAGPPARLEAVKAPRPQGRDNNSVRVPMFCEAEMRTHYLKCSKFTMKGAPGGSGG